MVGVRPKHVIIRAALLLLGSCGGGGSESAQPPSAPPPSPLPAPAPAPGPLPVVPALPTWEWILQSEGLPATPPTVAFLDLDGFDTAATYVALARSRGTKTICYLDIGTAEDYRSDYSRLAAVPGLLGKSYPGYPAERYIDIRRYPEFIRIMDDRLRMCRDKGFDMVEFDIMDAFEDGVAITGFPLSEQDMIDYVTALSARARSFGLGPVQKNSGRSATKLVQLFDAVLFEDCVLNNFCAEAAPYLAVGKPAFNAEYPEDWPSGVIDRTKVCTVSKNAGVSTIITVSDLDRLAADRCS